MAEKPPSEPGRPTPAAAAPPAGAHKPGAPGRPEVDRALLLRDVMDHAVKVHRETTGPFGQSRRRNRSIIVASVCVPLLAFCVYSFIARPEFLWGPRPGPLPPVQQDANVRFAMFMLAQRIEAYRSTEGQYPASLDAIGDSLPGVTYAASDGAFELRASEQGNPIVFRSDRSADEFLGNTINVIQGGAP